MIPPPRLVIHDCSSVKILWLPKVLHSLAESEHAKIIALNICYSFPIQIANAPVAAPITTDTNADCCVVGSGRFINHSTTLQLMIVKAIIMNRGQTFQSSRNVRTCSTMVTSILESVRQQYDLQLLYR